LTTLSFENILSWKTTFEFVKFEIQIL